ncbi:MAG: RdgB/HAM1 family non-canonical purine NTP pyrophosphatase [Bacteroidetes bacterium]|nr:RdgB/HAM1 family non-canonical purine NTP pyrophosphatase [Bacteroidota bacterium]
MKVVLATHNHHKVEEIRNILAALDIELLSLDAFPEIGEIEEDGDTLEENARKKARTVFEATHFLSLADDTGLEVEALGGRPGVYSARYSGENATYQRNNEKLLGELKGLPPERRKAKFRCVISIIGERTDEIAAGEVPGKIIDAVRGTNGFGYDPLFMPDGYDATYAQMDSELKNKLSHRAMALEQAKEILSRLAGKKKI